MSDALTNPLAIRDRRTRFLPPVEVPGTPCDAEADAQPDPAHRGRRRTNSVMTRARQATVLLLAGLWSCSDYAGPAPAVTPPVAQPPAAWPPTPPPPTPPVTVTVSDSLGDTFGGTAGRWDLVDMTLVRDSDAVTVALYVFGGIVSPMSGDSSALIGFVDFDVDQDSTTGVTPVADEYRQGAGSSGMGSDYRLVLSNYRVDSTVAVVDSLGRETGRVTPRFIANRVIVRIPRALLGNDDGQVDAVAIVGTRASASDIAPDSGRLRLRFGSAAATVP